MEKALREGKYIYCIMQIEKANQSEEQISQNETKTFSSSGIGNRGDELNTICFEDIAAVVSDSPIIDYPVSRENTIAHEKAIEEAMKEHTVLPVRFATIAEDENKVKKILEKEHDKFKDLLDKIKDKKELGVKAVFKADIYNEILEKYKDIESLKEVIAVQPPEKTYYERMEIGRMVEKALEKEKERYKEKVLDVLRPLALDIRINDTYGENMIINAAFLVQKNREKEFDQGVHALDAKYSDKIKFKYVGTLPPFNFVNLVIETGRY